MKVLVATWGDPTKWSEVTYYIKGKAIKSKTTYIPIFDIEKPDKGIILVQNSLVTSLDLGNTNIDEVSKLKSFVRKKLEEFTNNAQFIQKDTKVKILENTDVLVIISSGYFNYRGNKIKFNAEFYDILLNIFLELYFYMKDNKPNEVILDLTHGINYFTTATLMALSYLKKIFNFKLKVYNATPVFQGVTEAFILDLGEAFLEGKITIRKNKLLEVHKKIKNVYREKVNFSIEPAFDLIVSYVYGLIFPLIDKSDLEIDINIIRGFMLYQKRENLEYKLESYLKISDITSKDLFEYVFTLLLAKEISNKFSGFKVSKNTLHLEHIIDIKNNLSNEVAKILVEKEYEDLKKIYENSDIIFKDRNFIRYKEAIFIIKGYENRETRIDNIETDRKTLYSGKEEVRNFFAHASILWDKTILYKDKKIEFEGDYKSFLEEIKEIEI